jgi:hypothetical protein
MADTISLLLSTSGNPRMHRTQKSSQTALPGMKICCVISQPEVMASAA